MHNSQPIVQPQYVDDEIDLFELWNNLLEQKYHIIIITAIVTLLGVIVSFAMTPIYQSTAHFLPPQKQDIQLINPNVSGVSYSTNQVYQRFITNLQSRSLRYRFFEEQGLLEHYAAGKAVESVFKVFDQNFNEALKVSIPKKGQDGDFVSVSLEFDNADMSAHLLNQFIELAQSTTKQEILDEINFEVQTQIKTLNEQMEAKRQLAEQRRLDRITVLEEALIVAKSIGLQSPKIEQAANKLNMEYMRGSKSIEAEINVLKNRKSDDPFIGGLRDQQEQIAYLESIKIDPELVHVVRIDQEAEVPTSPIKPKKKLIVAVALVLGGMLGVFVALIRTALRKRREARRLEAEAQA